MHVAPRARDEGEQPLVGAGGFRKTPADHDQSGTARARSKLERCPSSLVTTNAGAPAPCDTRRWLSAWRWKPRLARRRMCANRMRVASHWRGAVRQLMSRPQAACQGARVADSSAAPHPSESERRRTSAARETRRCLGVGGRSWHVAPRGHAEGKRPLNGTVRLCIARDDNSQRGTARAFRKLECYASSLVTASAGMHAPRRGTWRWFGVGGCSSYVTPRARAVRERPLAEAVPFCRLRTAYGQRSMARQRSKLECCASSLVTASAGMPAPHNTWRWFGVGGFSWHVTPRARTIRESLLPAQCLSVGYGPSTTSAAWRSRAASSSVAPHPSISERSRTSSARETWRCLGVGGRSLHVAPRARDERERPLVGAGGLT